MLTPFRTILLFSAIVIIGFIALSQLSIHYLPPPKGSRVSISYTFPNSTPLEIEAKITSQIENGLSLIRGVNKQQSNSGNGKGEVLLSFVEGVDIAKKKGEIAAMIRRLYPSLPDGCSYPEIQESSDNEDISKAPMLIYSISASQHPQYILNIAKNSIQKQLLGIPDVKEVNVAEIQPLQIAVEYDIQKCLVLGVKPMTIHNLIRQRFTPVYYGSMSEDKNLYFLHTKNYIADLSLLKELSIPENGKVIRLKDVADVYVEEPIAKSYHRVNGENLISLAIIAKEKANLIIVGNRVKKVLSNIKNQLPEGYNIHLFYDNVSFLEKELNKNYRRILLSILILVLLISTIYFNWSYSISLILSLIVTLSLTVLFAWLFQIKIHLYSIAGLAISMGILIDCSIVMVDHYHRYRNHHIFKVLLSSVLVVAASISLVYFLPKDVKSNLVDFCYILLLSLFSGLIVALWFTPAFLQLFFRKDRSNIFKPRQKLPLSFQFYFTSIGIIAKFRKIFFIILILGFGIPLFLLPPKLGNLNWYNTTIGSEYYQQVAKPIINKWLGGALGLFVNDVVKKSSFRKDGKTKLYVYAKLQPGNSPQQLNNILLTIESLLEPIKGIDTYVTNIYSGQNGMIEISFKDGYDKGNLPLSLKSMLIAKSSEWSSVNWNIFGIGQGFGTGETDQLPTFKVALKGYNYNVLEEIAKGLEAKLKDNKRTTKINNNERFSVDEGGTKEWVLNFDKSVTAMAGLSGMRVAQEIKNVSLPLFAQSKLILDSVYYPIVIKEKEANSFSKFSLFNQRFALDTNKSFHLDLMANIDLEQVPENVRKEDRQFIRIVSFEYLGQREFGELYLNGLLGEFRKTLPSGFSAQRNIDSWKWDSLETNYNLLFILVGLVFVICAVLFENLKQPIYIIGAIPLSFIGIFLIFALGDYYFDQGGYASFIMVTSITTNMGLLLVNDYNQLRKQSVLPNDALQQAIRNRGKTLFLTTLAACCSLVPFLFEGQNEIFWFSFSIGTLGGLVFSLLAVFILLPVLLYKKEITMVKGS